GLLALRSLDHGLKGEDIQLMIIDKETFLPTKMIPCPNASLVATSPNLSVAFVGGKNTYPDGKQSPLLIVDLKNGNIARADTRLKLNPITFQVSANGKHFFGTDGKTISRFAIDGVNLVHEETSPIVNRDENAEPRLGMSPDGER